MFSNLVKSSMSLFVVACVLFIVVMLVLPSVVGSVDVIDILNELPK